MRILKSVFLITTMLIGSKNYGYCKNFDVKPTITTSVTCNIGDTLSFYPIGIGAHGVWINDFTTLAFGGYANNSFQLLTEYSVQANDSNFTITYQPDPILAWTGTIHLLNTSINNIEKESLILNLYPNPVTNLLNIESTMGLNLVSIKNIQNEVVYATDNKNENFLSINLENLPCGIYILEANSLKKKFIKIK
jgi:hypothetical protein